MIITTRQVAGRTVVILNPKGLTLISQKIITPPRDLYTKQKGRTGRPPGEPPARQRLFAIGLL